MSEEKFPSWIKTAVITGASRGLGAALAQELGRRGISVVVVARVAAELEPIVASIRADGGRAHALAMDVGVPQAADSLIGAATALIGPIDLLVHNASTLGPTPLRVLDETAPEAFERAVAVNLVGPFRITKAIVGSMVARGKGRIAYITSDAAVEANPQWGAYGCTKAAAEHLFRTWANELAPRGIDLVRVDPGEMNTQMHADAVPEADPAELADPAHVATRVATYLNRSSLPTADRFGAASLEGS